MTNYIATDAYEIAIQGIGETAEEARREALECSSAILDSEGNLMDEVDALATFRVYEATDALVNQVRAEGGAIAWGYLADGTACTVEEEGEEE